MASSSESNAYKRRVYVKGERLTVEEDLLHEFKGHRNFSKDDIPQAAIINRTQRPISRNLCGFLNTGAGGVVYCGVTDNGDVQGIRLTNYQKDHVLLSVQDLFSRFEPPVDPSMYTVHFFPVVTDVNHIPEITAHPVNHEQRNTPHILRTSKYCWCDRDAAAQHDFGILAPLYVIEIEVFPWDPACKLSLTPTTPIHPLFCNEERLCFIRRLGGLHQPSLEEVIQLAEADTARYHIMKE
ncbi:protein tofu-2-like isoform X1 [Daphnia carinata]|uniref:protein tofu-2-like isoform X1 n=1 Tax=Daphnia carinata TaxID=120202 RepID=UPI00257944A7|nr:protein tofu-2-like isoform X1 [Daphnia carinata]